MTFPLPKFDRIGNAMVAPGAILTGEVTLGDDVSIWFGVVIRGDVAPIRIGHRVNVQDGSVIHCDSGVENVIGDDVVIGHRAVVHGASIGEGVLIGMGAIVLGRSVVGAGSLIAAGAVVSPGANIPPDSVVMGVPGKIVRPIRDSEREYRRWLTKHYVELSRRHARG